MVMKLSSIDIDLIFAALGTWLMVYEIITNNQGFSLGMASTIGGLSFAATSYITLNKDKEDKNTNITKKMIMLIILGFIAILYLRLIKGM